MAKALVFALALSVLGVGAVVFATVGAEDFPPNKNISPKIIASTATILIKIYFFCMPLLSCSGYIVAHKPRMLNTLWSLTKTQKNREDPTYF